MKHKIGIIGHGFVGIAVETGLQSVAETRIYDKFKDSESLYDVVNNSDVLFVCVPTPVDQKTGHCDTTIVEASCLDIAKVAKERKSIVIKSTVPPGTTQNISETIGDRHGLIFNPEFLTEKHFIQDFFEQNRIILGKATQCNESDVKKVCDLYESFIVTQENPGFIKIMDSASAAEMIKYTTNAFLSTKVAFFNEISEICEAIGIDYREMSETVLHDDRIGDSHYQVPGPDGLRGFGGKCLPKDICGLIALARDAGIEPMLIDTVWSKNLLVREKYDWEEIKGATTECSYERMGSDERD